MRPEILFPLFSPVSTLKGVGPKVEPLVQKLAGRIHLSVTQRYAHTTREDLQAAIAAL